LRFLRGHGCDAEANSETGVAADCFMNDTPGLATLVALVEEWWSAARVPEAVLELGDQRTTLRTEA
jgi:hypothetical protein